MMREFPIDAASPEMREHLNDLIRKNSAGYVPAALRADPKPLAAVEHETPAFETPALGASKKISEVLGKDARESAMQAARGSITESGRVAIDQYGVARFLTMVGKRYTPVRLDGQEFRDICQRIATETTGKPLGKDAITALVEVLRAQAVQSRVRVQVHVRVAARIGDGSEKVYILDLMNPAGQVVLISSRKWMVAHNDKFAFLGGGGALPVPVQPDTLEAAYGIVSEFLERAGVPSDFVLIVVTVLCEWLRADTAHPLINVVGPAGGGKSSLAQALISIIDPTASGRLPEIRIEEEHVAASAQSRHVLVADNASHLSRDAQDMLCRCVYGFETSQRRLYTQSEVERLPVHNPVIITSILPAITAPDLHDRAIRVAFKPRLQFKSQAVLAAVLDGERAEVLGALLSLLSAGVAHIITTQLSTQRLVDFALLGDGIATALGESPGHFSRLLTEVSRSAASDYAEGDDLIIAIRGVLQAQEKVAVTADRLSALNSRTGGFCTIKRSNGTFCAVFRASALHAAIERVSPPNSTASYPRNPRALASALVLKLPVLTALGIKTQKHVLKHAKQTVWAFEWGHLCAG